MTNTDNRTSTLVWPCLRYRDAPAAIRFLVEAFGFEEAAVHPGETAGYIDHAELRWPGGGAVMLGTERADGMIAPGGGAIYIVTDRPDALFERAVAAGATVVQPVRDEDYGSRGFIVRDPEGVLWSFGTYSGT